MTKEQLNNLNRLAKLKFETKQMEAEMKELQEKLFSSNDFPKEYITDFGKLKYEERTNKSINDNKKLIKNSEITEEIFIGAAKIAVGKVESILSEKEFNKLIKLGIIKTSEPSKFYKLIDK